MTPSKKEIERERVWQQIEIVTYNTYSRDLDYIAEMHVFSLPNSVLSKS